MTKKTTIISPPKKKKGVPPMIKNASNNLTKLPEDDTVAFNFRVSPTFRKQVKQYCLDHDTTAVQVMINAITEYINK